MIFFSCPCLPTHWVCVLGVLVSSALAISESHAQAAALGKLISGPLARHADALDNIEIRRLADELGQPDGWAKVRSALDARRLSGASRSDALTRLAVARGVMTRDEGVDMYRRLVSVPGYDGTVSRLLWNNDAVVRGAAQELRLARNLSARGVKVLKLEDKFDDGLKAAPTDIDVVVRKVDTDLPIEVKDYKDLSRTQLQETLVPDIGSLRAYSQQASSQRIQCPIMAITSRPSDPQVELELRDAADLAGVRVVYGSAEVLAEKIAFLGETKCGRL
jgi:hypothetical protein